ncbi:MAG: class I SAM-dependent methyltransferase [Bacteroidales bacterium]|nr:class I SAM-dependent methyltransferase [Bacteroidales bacterium]
MKHHTTCPLCSSDKISKHLDVADHFLSKEEYSLYKCDSCGFIFTQDHPDETEMGKYYKSDAYISHNNKAKGVTNFIYKIVRTFTLLSKRFKIESICRKRSGNLLDIGSGNGNFLATMKRAGWDVYGIEIDDDTRQHSTDRFRVTVYRPIDIDKFTDKSIDCITLWHVLEHFDNPEWYMEHIRRLLRPDGICVIALPNCSSFDAAYYKDFWAAYDVPRHLSHFTPETFRKFAEKHHFKIIRTKRMPLDAFYISILSEKYKGTFMPFVVGLVKGSFFFLATLFNKKRDSSLTYFLKIKE